ncbi:sugar phosphate isomerase/epimerase [Candidatus Aerophobetes bacterium]|nr:sugar phosphate isomerase/epimerase [Candidatus Aerophobetes bacterium]
MKIGFLTNSLSAVGIRDAEEIFKWAKENSFQALEIGPTISLEVEKLRELQQRYDLKIISFIYMRNILSADEKERKTHIDKIRKRIEVAHKLGVPYVTISTGRDERLSYAENLKVFEKEFPPILRYAEEKNVTLTFENCPGMWNIAISPLMWKKIFEIFPSPQLGLCLDPSHLIWLQIDPYKVIFDFRDRICYIHAKDTEILRENLNTCGILTDELYGQKTECRWWRHRIPGWGRINWRKFFSNLMEIGFDGVISIEHEDPLWSGSEKKVKRGLILARDYLKGMM